MKQNFVSLFGFLFVLAFFGASALFQELSWSAFLLGGIVWGLGVGVKGMIWWYFLNTRLMPGLEKLKPVNNHILTGLFAGIIGAFGEMGVTFLYFLKLSSSRTFSNSYLWWFGLGAGIFELIMIFMTYLREINKPEKAAPSPFVDQLIAPFERFYTTWLHWASRFLIARAIMSYSVAPLSHSLMAVIISFFCFAFADGFAHYAVLDWNITKRRNLVKLELIIFIDALILCGATLMY